MAVMPGPGPHDASLAERPALQLEQTLVDLATRVGQAFAGRGIMVRTAESCTGGAIARALTETAGSSAWFDRAFITYTNEAKMQMVAVPPDALARYGAVSEVVAQAMAVGALVDHAVDAPPCVSVAVTGVAGPGGGSAEKPVGMVCFGWAGPDPDSPGRHWSTTTTVKFDGGRSAVRLQTAIYAIQQLQTFWL